MRQAATEQLWSLDNASLKSIEYSLNSVPDETQLNFIMANVKFPYDEMCDSYSEAESPKSKCSSMKSRLLPLKASLCKHNSIDLDISVNDSASDSASEPSFHSMSTNSDNSYRSTIDVEENLEINDVFRQSSENFNKYDDIIEQIEKLRFSRESSQNGKRILNSQEEYNPIRNMDKHKDYSSRFTKYDTLNSNYSKLSYEMNIKNESEDYEGDKKDLNKRLDTRNEDEDDGDLIERGPVRHHPNIIRSKPYDTLDWLLQSDGYSHHESSDQQQSKTSHYETSIKKLLTDNDYRGRLDSCLEKISSSNKKSQVYNDHITLETIPREKHSSNRQNLNYSSTKVPPSIVVNNPEGSSLLDILARGGFQAAQVFSDVGTTNGSSPGMNSEIWPDSPTSSYNVVSSRPNSRASSRAQSPGSVMMPVNISGSPIDSSQVSSNFRMRQGFSSSSSSNQSYCDTPSPANYHSSLDQRSEDQLDDGFNRFINWQENCESSGTIIANINSEIVDAIDNSELQLVEEVVLRELSKKNPIAEEMQVVPNSQFSYKRFDFLGPIQSPLERDSRYSLDSDQRAGSKTANENIQTDMSFFSEPMNFGSTGSIINEAQQSLVYPKSSDGFDLVYSENPSSGSSYRENMSPDNSHIGKNSPASLEIDATIENILANYSKAKNDADTNVAMNVQNFDINLLDYAKSTCPTYPGSPSIQNQKNSAPQQASTSTFNDFQVPEVIKSRHSGRHILPWSSLNLPLTKACDKLIKELNPKDVKKAMASLLKKSTEELSKADKDGDTMLMCLVGNPDELMKKKAFLPPLVERLSSIHGALSMTNHRGEDALYLMAINCPQMAYVTGYLAATMLQKGIHIEQKLYQPRGDTLIHAVAAKGDTHGAVLAELLTLKTTRGTPVFDVSTPNYEGKTPLHVAVESHDPVVRGVTSIATVQILLENGADPMIKETIRGDTALHTAVFMSCDPSLVKILLVKDGQDIINVENYHGNTSFHMARMCENASIENQMEVCKILVEYGAKTNILNENSRTPLEFLHSDRKDTLKTMFQGSENL